jgi:hypothetical protein
VQSASVLHVIAALSLHVPEVLPAATVHVPVLMT